MLIRQITITIVSYLFSMTPWHLFLVGWSHIDLWNSDNSLMTFMRAEVINIIEWVMRWVQLQSSGQLNLTWMNGDEATQNLNTSTYMRCITPGRCWVNECSTLCINSMLTNDLTWDWRAPPQYWPTPLTGPHCREQEMPVCLSTGSERLFPVTVH